MLALIEENGLEPPYALPPGSVLRLPAPNIHVVETATITGGTGRFTGATGTLSIERIVVITGPDTDVTSQWIDGYIVMDHGK